MDRNAFRAAWDCIGLYDDKKWPFLATPVRTDPCTAGEGWT